MGALDANFLFTIDKFPSYLPFISLLFLSNMFSQKFSQISLTWEAFSLQFMQHVTQ